MEIVFIRVQIGNGANAVSHAFRSLFLLKKKMKLHFRCGKKMFALCLIVLLYTAGNANCRDNVRARIYSVVEMAL